MSRRRFRRGKQDGHGQPVVGQTFQVQRENFRCQVFDTDTRQNEKPAVVGNQMQTLVLDDRSLSDKTVSIFAFEGCGLPIKQSQPLVLKYRYIAKCFSDKGMKAEVMVLTRMRVSHLSRSPGNIRRTRTLLRIPWLSKVVVWSIVVMIGVYKIAHQKIRLFLKIP